MTSRAPLIWVLSNKLPVKGAKRSMRMDFGMFASWLLVRVSLHQQTGRPQCYQGPSVSRMRIPTAKWALWLVLSIVSTAWLQQRHWSSRSLCRQHLFRNCGCKTHRSLQCRPVHTLQCPVQHFTITTFWFFNKRFITSATSWNDICSFFIHSFKLRAR